MDRRARAQERARDVLRGVQAMIRRPGKIVRRFQRALGGVHVQAELVLEGHAADAGKIARAAQCVEQFEQRVFALALDHEIDIPGIERRPRYRAMRSSRPTRWERADTFRETRGTPAIAWSNCGPGITETPNNSTAMMLHQRVDGRPRIGIGVAIHDFVLFAAFQHRAEMEHGKRQAPILRLGAARMEQDDHAVNLPARIQKLEGGRLPRQRAFHGRMRPLPAVPGAVDLPRNSQIAAQFGEHLRVEVLDALQRVGGEAVGLLELLVALPDHHFAVLAALVDGRIDNQEAAAGAQARGGFRRACGDSRWSSGWTRCRWPRPGCPRRAADRRTPR